MASDQSKITERRIKAFTLYKLHSTAFVTRNACHLSVSRLPVHLVFVNGTPSIIVLFKVSTANSYQDGGVFWFFIPNYIYSIIVGDQPQNNIVMWGWITVTFICTVLKRLCSQDIYNKRFLSLLSVLVRCHRALFVFFQIAANEASSVITSTYNTGLFYLIAPKSNIMSVFRSTALLPCIAEKLRRPARKNLTYRLGLIYLASCGWRW